MTPLRADREAMDFDVVIVGGGPAGLAAAIRVKQLAAEKGQEVSVCLLEKGSEIGAHLLSGAVLEPRGLAELFPDYLERGAPLDVPVTEDHFVYLTRTKSYRLPTPPAMHNQGNYVISLGQLARWLGAQAEALGVEIYPGFAAAELLTGPDGRVVGVATNDVGIGKDGQKTDSFQPGMELHSRQLILAEGTRGSLTLRAQAMFNLREGRDPQTYSIGIKELWEIDPAKHRPGKVWHSIGWPMDAGTYAGSWLYHWKDNLISLGYVVGLDYKNPHLSPFDELQLLKTHPELSALLAGARRVGYGARAITTGGWQSLPKLSFPGGVLAGDCAGFLNVPKIKGNHAAIKSGMLAAEAVFDALAADHVEAVDLQERYRASWLQDELYRVRNIKPAFHWGLWPALAYGALDTYLFRGKAPWTLKHRPDHTQLKLAAQMPKKAYPKPDGVLTFDRLSSLPLSGTNHEENQPSHLTLKDWRVPVEHNLALYDAPEQRYCPAAVYEIVREGPEQTPRLQINAQNCVHCKTCDIKDPTQNIVWVTPEGGGGPNYATM